MNQYSELIGSFIRTSNFPLEANYIFLSEKLLKEFYNDPTNATTLHEGLFKVVANGTSLDLYWVVNNNDLLEFIRLLSNLSIDNIESELEDLSSKLNLEILIREEVDLAIWGIEPQLLPLDLNNIKKLSNAILELREIISNFQSEIDDKLKDLYNLILGTPNPPLKDLKSILSALLEISLLLNNRINNLLTEVDLTLVGVGLSGDGAYNSDKETYYLKDATSVMNALKTLDSLIHDLNKLEKTIFKILAKLPTDPLSDIIYLIPSDKAGEDNVYIEYLWTETGWEIIGLYLLDTEGFLTKEEFSDWELTDLAEILKNYVELENLQWYDI